MLHLARKSCSFAPSALQQRVLTTTMKTRNTRVFSSFQSSDGLQVDEEGRRIRRRRQSVEKNDNSWDDFDASGGWDDFEPETHSNTKPSSSSSGGGGGWDDFDPMDSTPQQQSRPQSSRIQRQSNRPPRRNDRREQGRRRGSQPKKSKDERKINMKALEGAGFVHLYGLSSVLNALKANRRDFSRPESFIDIDTLQGEDLEHELKQRQRKPEAQYSPWLFVQEKSTTRGGGGRSADKAMAAQQVEQLAQELDLPIARVDKGILNTLSGNRPHQGYVLRCGALFFESLSRIPHPDNDDTEAPHLWLVLDEVVDPQNLGALLRSAYFMGGNDIGILVCSKNSAPPSPVVSAASAGALEISRVYSTSNLPKTLNQAQEDGFRIVGASSSVPVGDETRVYSLNKLPKDDRPTLLVLGSEGSGLRTLVARACTEFVQIPGSAADSSDDDDDASGVDSLNVSVTGGILLWHLLHQQQK